tara:strand:- start:1409 stop:2326 length:918 start_codon:yes stop_codon:yes gene_type:complete
MTGLPDDRAATARGIALMIAGIFVVSVMDALIKWLTSTFPSIEIVFFRNLFGLFPLFAIVAWSGGLKLLRTRRWAAHLGRSLAGVGAMLCFFFALSGLALAEAISLAFTSPLFMTALSVPLLGEKVGIRRLSAILVGFAGVLIIVRPGSDVFSIYALLAIGASFCFALGMVLGRRMSDTESSVSIVFYTTIAGLLAGAIGTPAVWVMPGPGDWPFLIALGLLGGVGQFLITSAFRLAQAVVVAPFEYTALLWGVLFGYVLWDEVPDVETFIGGALVIGAGLYIGYRETRLGKKTEGPGAMPEPSP